MVIVTSPGVAPPANIGRASGAQTIRQQYHLSPHSI
jgi:hypothetical protein